MINFPQLVMNVGEIISEKEGEITDLSSAVLTNFFSLCTVNCASVVVKRVLKIHIYGLSFDCQFFLKMQIE